MFTLEQVTQLATRVRLASGHEGYIRRVLDRHDNIYGVAADLRLERDWLAGKLSDEEAAANGLKPEWQQKIRSNPALRESTDPFFQNWITFEPDDILLETTSIDLPIIRLRDIVAIKPNGEKWIEDPS